MSTMEQRVAQIGSYLNDLDGYLDYLHAWMCDVATETQVPPPMTFPEWQDDPDQGLAPEDGKRLRGEQGSAAPAADEDA